MWRMEVLSHQWPPSFSASHVIQAPVQRFFIIKKILFFSPELKAQEEDDLLRFHWVVNFLYNLLVIFEWSVSLWYCLYPSYILLSFCYAVNFWEWMIYKALFRNYFLLNALSFFRTDRRTLVASPLKFQLHICNETT